MAPVAKSHDPSRIWEFPLEIEAPPKTLNPLHNPIWARVHGEWAHRRLWCWLVLDVEAESSASLRSQSKECRGLRDENRNWLSFFLVVGGVYTIAESQRPAPRRNIDNNSGFYMTVTPRLDAQWAYDSDNPITCPQNPQRARDRDTNRQKISQQWQRKRPTANDRKLKHTTTSLPERPEQLKKICCAFEFRCSTRSVTDSKAHPALNASPCRDA